MLRRSPHPKDLIRRIAPMRRIALIQRIVYMWRIAPPPLRRRFAGDGASFVGWAESSRPTGGVLLPAGGPRRLGPPYSYSPGDPRFSNHRGWGRLPRRP